MRGIFIVPTGIGAAIGGHAGDANPAAKLIAGVCDELIIHPNVVNASDINEMTENMLYVEGSMLDRFLTGEIQLQKVNSNRMIVVTNSPAKNDTINATSAGRVTLGIDAKVLPLKTPLIMNGYMKEGRATGDVIGWEELVSQLEPYKNDFDVLAIHTPIDVSRDVALHYFRNGGINPWGGVEAKASKLISRALGKPAVHAPQERDDVKTDKELYTIFEEAIHPCMAPEAISICYLQCVLKGLHKAPKIGKGLSVRDIDFMISPIGVWGTPHIQATMSNIPIIAVRENTTCLDNDMGENTIFVDNYLEAAGLITAMKLGIDPSSVRRPMEYTEILK